MRTFTVDAAVIGGGLGGVAATLAMLEKGLKVLLTEEYDWLGGQATSQAVPPDENVQIESVGGSRRYKAWREEIRNYYRRNYPMTETSKMDPMLNPGGGFVSALCHEPKVAAAVFEEMLAPYVSFGQLILLKGYVPVAAKTEGRTIVSVTIEKNGVRTLIKAPYILDATELGDLLPLSGTAYVTGSEAKSDTGEDHAIDVADPLDMQSITWCFAMSRGKEGENHIIPKPDRYDYYKQHLSDFWPGTQMQWPYVHPITLEIVKASIDPGTEDRDLWNYRKILNRGHYPAGTELEEVTIVNWPQNDYWLGSIIEVSDEERDFHIEQSKEISLCWLYWMQTEAPREDGGVGYPELRLRPDITGTDDGFAMAPYIREARRIKPLFRVTEASVGYDMRKRLLEEQFGAGVSVEAEQFDDSVGIGYYRIDLHPSSAGRNYIDIASLPFQIPLGSLIPEDRDNLLAANKNIGSTHITNGCYRLHPVEWSIGEACGHLVAHCLELGLNPAEIRADEKLLRSLQEDLRDSGVSLEWPKKLRAGLDRDF